jgi:hypothetical protein
MEVANSHDLLDVRPLAGNGGSESAAEQSDKEKSKSQKPPLA